jgi:hypothetical protein
MKHLHRTRATPGVSKGFFTGLGRSIIPGLALWGGVVWLGMWAAEVAAKYLP